MQQPFNVGDDNINTLFKLLFQNVQDKNFKVFENKSDDEILSNLGNGNVCFNKTSDNMYLCVNINGSLKKINSSASASVYVVDANSNYESGVNWWYIIFSNGFVFQGGTLQTDVNAHALFNYPVRMKDQKYQFITQVHFPVSPSTPTDAFFGTRVINKNEGFAELYTLYVTTVSGYGSYLSFDWFVCGYKE